MKTTDPIADLLTRIRNAARAKKDSVSVPYSKMKHSICNVLQKNSYILKVVSKGEGVDKTLEIELDLEKPDIHLKRMSKPGQRNYLGASEIPRVLDGLGIAILSTPKGILTGSEARRSKLGGEYICEVY